MTKTLTIDLPHEVYERAEQRAIEQGDTLPSTVVKLVKQFSECQPREATAADNGNIAAASLLAALDRGRNTAPVGRLNREELYDRAVLR